MAEPVLRLLNVGGNNKEIGIPPCFAGWQHDLLDIDPAAKPDVLCDARELWRLPAGSYDAVYCSHNLEHYYRHDLPKVLAGFLAVLKPDGFAYVRVPDLVAVMQTVVAQGLDIDDVLYESPSGPILVSDVIYGYHVEIAASGRDYYAHKRGFSTQSLSNALLRAGFSRVMTNCHHLEITALAFRQDPSPFQQQLLGIKATANTQTGV